MGATESGGKELRPTPVQGDYVRPFVPTLVTMVGVTAILYLGRDVFLPLAVALLREAGRVE